MNRHRSRPGRPAVTRAFTLVELLVVIGIIAILLALLMPAVTRAREMANQTVCMSNMRQLGAAFVAYCLDNEGRFPGEAPQNSSGTLPAEPHDWVHWRPDWPNAPASSAIARYTAGFKADLLRCPSDPVEIRPQSTEELNYRPYPYSYSMNQYLTVLYRPDPPRYQAIKNPGDLIVLYEESEMSADDGNFYPGPADIGVFRNLLANRHDRPAEWTYAGENLPPFPPFPKTRGNVAFVDGHAEFVSRAYAHDPKHYIPR